MEVRGVADHAQELGPQPLHLLQGHHILHRHDEGFDLPVAGKDGRGVDQNRDGPPVRHGQDDLLGAHGLPGAQRLGQGEVLQGDLSPVSAPYGQYFEEMLNGLVRIEQAVDDPLGLPVE